MVAAGRCMHGRHHRELSVDAPRCVGKAGGNAGLFFCAKRLLCERGLPVQPALDAALGRLVRKFVAVKNIAASLSLVLLASFAVGCSSSSENAPAESNSQGNTPRLMPDGAPPPPGAVRHLDATSNLDATPLSAADYAIYAAIMGGASAMLNTLSTGDKEALEFAAKVDAGKTAVAPNTQALLTQARALQHKDEELARLQGIDGRYLQVKAKIDAVIGPAAKPAAADDAVAKENRRYLEPHRANIERLQGILRNPLSRPAEK